MRFSWKILIASILVIAITIAVSGSFLIQITFQNALHKATESALSDNLFLAYTLDAAANGEYMQQGTLSDQTIKIMAQQVSANRDIPLSIQNESFEILLSGISNDPLDTGGNGRAYVLRQSNDKTIILCTIRMESNGRTLYLATEHTVTDVFTNRAEQFKIFRIISIGILVVSAVVMFMVSSLLTKPIRNLTIATREIKKGDYKRQVFIKGNDEVAELAGAFNAMTISVSHHVEQLTDAARQKEDFVANFSHEMKTPLTSMIGYANLLRSQKLTEEQHFIAANYIYNEGKRLESLSLKLMDMLIIGRQDFPMQKVSAKGLMENVSAIASPLLEQHGMTLNVHYEEAPLMLEPDLFRTLLLNLIDNGRKASESGNIITLQGTKAPDGYLFTVSDHGRGIPQSELAKITEAFYMVDKSRSRVQHGVGLGLALCERIAVLHQTSLQFKSQLGAGTTVSLLLPSEPASRKEKVHT